MVAATAGGMDMDDCDGCRGADSGDQACDVVCLAPLLAIVSAGALLPSPVRGVFDDARAEDVIGQTGPPDPHPPRSLI
jgi:hypothetical protein